MCRLVCLIAVSALLAVSCLSVSVSAQAGVNITFYKNTLYCNETKISQNETLQSAIYFVPLTSVCTPINNSVIPLFTKAYCNSTTGVVTVVDYQEANCTNIYVTATSDVSCVTITDASGSGLYSMEVENGCSKTTAAPTTASPTLSPNATVSPTTASPTTASPTLSPNTTVSPTAAPNTTTPTTPAPTGKPGSASQQAGFSLLAAAVIVLATL